jgi:hypothetical protein
MRQEQKMTYREVENIQRICSLGAILQDMLQAESISSEVRIIGYPSGHTNREVFFLEDKGNDSLWFAHWKNEYGTKAVTLFGHGELGESSTLTIDVQFNYPIEDYHRRLGGAFLVDTLTDEIVLAHRGIVTLGHRVKKDVLFEAMASEVVEAETSRRPHEYLLMAALDSKNLVDDLSKFSRNLRIVVRELGDEPDLIDEARDEDTDEYVADAVDANSDVDVHDGVDGLRAYFREFSGRRRAFTPKRVYAVSTHGKIVHALNIELEKEGPTLKSRAVDLASNQLDTAFLFEVKTSADSQNVYAAIGQLCVHSSTVARCLKKPVVRVLVVPERPMPRLARVVENELNIRIVTYTLSSRGRVVFDGLGDL